MFEIKHFWFPPFFLSYNSQPKKKRTKSALFILEIPTYRPTY